MRLFDWIARLIAGKRASAVGAHTAIEADAGANALAGAPEFAKNPARASSARPRTAQFRREGIAAVFEAWREATLKERLPGDYAAPLPDAYADPLYAQRCAQTFLDIAAQLWPADEAIGALGDSRPDVVVPWQAGPRNVEQLRRRFK